ncbi:aminoglycoside phosphotransferase (APT) family kinase protein [Microbacterium sp. ZKA21]|uniref:phosphotransferase n=1 Tax=Microbacterium sp. ZKA21 TaxID=3381694 RepID=UPI003D1A46FA
MARSAFTLAAAVTAALPGAEVTGARALSADGDGRFDSAVATLADGRELAIRVADADDTARELAAEALALRALTAGARAILPFRVPEYIGEARLGDGRALVTALLDGFLVEAADIPAGRGAAVSMGRAIAAIHALPASIVRSAGLPARSADDVRAEIRQLVDRAAATGRVPARLTVRWREATDDDELWRFESAVTLGAQATSFLFADDPTEGPQVTGVVGWHGLSVGDPAVDLAWLSSAPNAAGDVQAAYTAASDRAPDAAIGVRARLNAELEFARWLVHGDAMRRPDIVDDAAALLESLADGLRAGDLEVIAERGDGVDSALAALDRVPERTSADIDTSMQTDAYNPEELWLETAEAEPVGDPHATADLSELAESDLLPRDASATRASDADEEGSEDEAQRAARAALQRWTSSSSE